MVGKDKFKQCVDAYKSGFVDLDNKTRIKILTWYYSSILCYLVVLISVSCISNRYFLNFFMLFSLVLAVFPNYVKFFYKDACAISIDKDLENIRFFRTKSFFTIILKAFGSGFLLVLPIIIFYKLYSFEIIQPDIWSTITSITLIITIIIASGICLVPRTKMLEIKQWMALSGGVLVLIVSIFYGTLGKSVNFIANVFKFGGLNNATIYVDESACQIFKKKAYLDNCNANEINEVKNIQILWRIGEYYIKFDNKNNKPNYLIIPKEHVFGMSVNKN